MSDQEEGPTVPGVKPDARTQHRNDPRARETRRRFLDAGWDLLNELRLADLFGALTVDAIAGRAGRSERTFWNHFPDWQSYVDALIADVPHLHSFEDGEEWLPIEVVRQALEGSHRGILPDLAAQAVRENWDAIHEPEEVVGLLRQLLLLSRVSTEPGLAQVLLDHYWGTHRGRYTDLYRTTAETLGLEPLPPITWPVYARMITAITEGNELLWICETDDTEVSQLPMVASLLGLSMIRCVGSGETFESRTSGLLAAPEAPIATIDDPRALAVACRRAVTDAGIDGAPAPADHRVTVWATLSQVTGTSQVELHDQLQRVEVIGALAFATNLPLRVRSREEPDDPSRAMKAADWLCELVRVARSDRWCAHGLITERLRGGADPQVINPAVGLGGELAGVLAEGRTSLHERMVNIALSTALSDDSTSPAEAASVALAAHRALGTAA